jgi:hypothetical protein
MKRQGVETAETPKQKRYAPGLSFLQHTRSAALQSIPCCSQYVESQLCVSIASLKDFVCTEVAPSLDVLRAISGLIGNTGETPTVQSLTNDIISLSQSPNRAFSSCPFPIKKPILRGSVSGWQNADIHSRGSKYRKHFDAETLCYCRSRGTCNPNLLR